MSNETLWNHPSSAARSWKPHAVVFSSWDRCWGQGLRGKLNGAKRYSMKVSPTPPLGLRTGLKDTVSRHTVKTVQGWIRDNWEGPSMTQLETWTQSNVSGETWKWPLMMIIQPGSWRCLWIQRKRSVVFNINTRADIAEVSTVLNPNIKGN